MHPQTPQSRDRFQAQTSLGCGEVGGENPQWDSTGGVSHTSVTLCKSCDLWIVILSVPHHSLLKMGVWGTSCENQDGVCAALTAGGWGGGQGEWGGAPT